jgi:hypothetical protein
MSYAGPVSRRKGATASTSDAAGQLHADSATIAAHLGPRSAKAFKPLPHYSTKRDRAGVFTAGVLVGLVVGAGAALLLAPQSGADTRHDIARRGKRLTKRSRNAWDDLRLELRQFRRELQRKSFSRRAASSL